jgi:hypothetical protein
MKFKLRGIQIKNPNNIMKFVVVCGFGEHTMYMGDFEYHEEIVEHFNLWRFLEENDESRSMLGGGKAAYRKSDNILVFWGKSTFYGAVPLEILTNFKEELEKDRRLKLIFDGNLKIEIDNPER